MAAPTVWCGSVASSIAALCVSAVMCASMSDGTSGSTASISCASDQSSGRSIITSSSIPTVKGVEGRQRAQFGVMPTAPTCPWPRRRATS